MPGDNSIQSSSPRWLQDTVNSLDRLNNGLKQVEGALQGVTQTTIPRDGYASTAAVKADPAASNPADVRFTMDASGSLHTKALGLVDVSINPDDLFNGDYTKKVVLKPQGDTTHIEAEYPLLGFIKLPVEMDTGIKMKSVNELRVDFTGQKIMDVAANLSFLGMSIPVKVRIQAQRLGAGQYRFHFSDALCGKSQFQLPKFFTSCLFWMSAKLSGFGGVKFAGNAIDMNIPQFLVSQKMYGN